MGFLDKAKAAANELAAKADTAMATSGLGSPGAAGGHADRLFRDLGVIAYLEATDREAPAGQRDRLLGALREAEQRGSIPSFALQSAAPGPGSVPPPPPPGAAGQQTQQSSPPSPSMTQPPAGTPVPDAPVTPSAPPPPPPSWAQNDEH